MSSPPRSKAFFSVISLLLGVLTTCGAARTWHGYQRAIGDTYAPAPSAGHHSAPSSHATRGNYPPSIHRRSGLTASSPSGHYQHLPTNRQINPLSLSAIWRWLTEGFSSDVTARTQGARQPPRPAAIKRLAPLMTPVARCGTAIAACAFCATNLNQISSSPPEACAPVCFNVIGGVCGGSSGSILKTIITRKREQARSQRRLSYFTRQ